MTEPNQWAAEMQALQDQVERLTLELEVCKHDESNAQYWAGQDDGCLGAAGRWQEALTNPMPKPGVMQEPLETLYRQTEALRRDLEGFHGIAVELANAKTDLALVRGQRDGYASMIVHVFHEIAHHWHPRKKDERAACDQVLDRLGASVEASLEATEAARGN
jgi:hypothetical protein